MNRAQKIERLLTAIGLTLAGVMGLIGLIATWNLYEGEYRFPYLLLTALGLGLGAHEWRQYVKNIPSSRIAAGRWMSLITAVMDFALILGWGFVCMKQWQNRFIWDNYPYLTMMLVVTISWGTQGILNVYRFFHHEELYRKEDEKDG